jgi:hypothetical protein
MPAESFMRHGIAWGTFKGVVRTAVATILHLGFLRSATGQYCFAHGEPWAAERRQRRALSVRQTRFRGVVSTPWEGGQYGFVWNPRRFGATVLDTRFTKGWTFARCRDTNGEPWMSFTPSPAMWFTRIFHPPRTTVGVVIEHRFGGCPYTASMRI